MSKHGVLIGSSEREGTKPVHPDQERWVVSLLGFVCLVVAWWGAPAAWWLARHNTSWARYVQTHMRPLQLINQGLQYAALSILGLTLLGLLWTLLVWLRWQWHVRRVRGHYLQLVIPRPAGRDGAPRTTPDAPSALWDRLIATLQSGSPRGLPPYLATELWGDGGGRVQWGIWLPEHLRDQREAVRRLLTADRPQARLVDACDPLLVALEQRGADAEAGDSRWYASALLILAARDYYPLQVDELAQRSVVAALRPPRAVLASGVSVIVTPAPLAWARRVHQLVQRWRWISRYRRRFDEGYKQETDAISLKAQQAHARVCLRVHVVAQTKAAAMAECRSLLTTLMASRKRYGWANQYWQARSVRVQQVHGTELSPDGWSRAPFRSLPWLIGVFPLV